MVYRIIIMNDIVISLIVIYLNIGLSKYCKLTGHVTSRTYNI